jgi:hypothetical protein
MGYEAHIRYRGEESAVQNEAMGGGGMPFMVEPLQEAAGEV